MSDQQYGNEPMDLHPEIAPFFARISNLDPPMEQRGPLEVRELMNGFALRDMPPRPDDVVVEDHVGEFKGRSIRLRLYKPRGAAGPLPVMLYFHGGGFVIGNIDTHDRYVCELTRQSGVAYLSVDYRLSPEHPIPAPMEDAYDSLVWVAERAGALGLDPDRIGLSGDSSGGHLTATTTFLTRERGGPDVKFQLLIYPGGFQEEFTHKSYFRWKDMLLTTPYVMWFRTHYKPISGDVLSFPLLQKNLKGLPPAYVVTCEYDVVRDEGEEYAMRLMDAGVPVMLRRVPRSTHPFFRAMHVSPYIRKEMREMGHQIRRHLVDDLND